MDTYKDLIDLIESRGLDGNIRFHKDNIEFYALIDDISDTIATEDNILDALCDMGFEINVCNNGSKLITDFINRFSEDSDDPLQGVWNILRRYRKCVSYKPYIKDWCDKFVDAYRNKGVISIESKEKETSKNEAEELTLDDYKNRQLRCYTNKLKHGFNVTDFQKEARFILKELSELMDAIEHNDVENLIEELGDIVIFCYGIAEMAHKDLDTQVFKKMGINENRIYTRNEHGDFVRQDN